MPNVNGTLNGKLVAQKALEILVRDLLPKSAVGTDLSDSRAKFGQPVLSRIVVPKDAQDFNASTGYRGKNSTTLDVPVTIDKHKFYPIEFGIEEVASTERDLVGEQAEAAAHGIANAFLKDLTALITVENFPTEVVSAVDSIDRKTMTKLAKALTGKKVPKAGRAALLDDDAFYKLLDDEVVVRSDANSGVRTLQTGELPPVSGITPYNLTGMVTAGQDAENLLGAALNKSALVLATRVPTDIAEIAAANGIPMNGRVSTITEPKTGLSVALIESADAVGGYVVSTLAIMYGVAIGNPDALVRLVSASND
jgi:hypothetical protein